MATTKFMRRLILVALKTSGRFKGGRPLLAQIFFQKAALFRVKGL